MGFPCSTSGKESASNAGDSSSIPGCGISSGEGNSYSLQYFGLLKVHGQYSPWNVYIHCCIFYSFGQNMSCFHNYSIIQSNFLCVCVHAHTHMLHRVWLFANSFSKGSSFPGNKPESHVSCIGSQFLFCFHKNPLCTVCSSLSTIPNPWQPLYFYCLNNFAFSRIPSSWNNKVCSLFRLASFT